MAHNVLKTSTKPGKGGTRPRGVTLIEAVLFISVALGLIVGGIVFYQQASLSARVGEQVRLLSAILSEARALAQGTPPSSLVAMVPGGLNGIGPLDTILIQAGAVPAEYVNPNPPPAAGAFENRLLTAWGGTMSILANYFAQPMGLVTPFSDYVFQMILEDIPVEACTRLAPIDASGNGVFTRGIVIVGANPTTGLGGGGAAHILGLDGALDPSGAAAMCAVADGGSGAVDMLFLIGALQ